MNEYKNFNDLPESDATKSICDFSHEIVKCLPEYFSNQAFQVLTHDDYYEVRFVTKGQKMLENLVDDLNKKMKLYVFYVIRKDGGKTYRCILYSRPVRGLMYIVYADSDSYGLTDDITVSFFESIETMYLALRHDYARLMKMEGDVLEKQDIRDLIRNFY